MCWNEYISLNTFLFSSFVLGLIAYNNAYTSYKTPELNIFAYLFAMSFIAMQLVEFFLWRNLKNAWYNTAFSIAAMLVLFIQPIASFFLIINNRPLTKILLYLYLIIASIVLLSYMLLYKGNPPHVTVSSFGHLHWQWCDKNPLFYVLLITWFLFFLIPFFYNAFNDLSLTNSWIYILIFAISSLLFIIKNYFKDGSFPSMWCWFINSIFIFYAARLLIYLPFCEKKSIC